MRKIICFATILLSFTFGFLFLTGCDWFHTHTPELLDTNAPTCEESGNIECYICSCGKYFLLEDGEYVEVPKESITISPKGHNFGNWEETIAPSCTHTGVETRNCSVCNKTETRTIPMKEHNISGFEYYSETKHWKECEVCHQHFSTESHTFGQGTTNEGITSYTCEICGYEKHIEETNIQAYGSGTETDPYLIYTASQFKQFELYNKYHSPYIKDWVFSDGEYYRLMNDITLPTDFKIQSASSYSFPKIVLDGNNKTLSYSKSVFRSFYGTIKNLNLYPEYLRESHVFIETLGGVLDNVNIQAGEYSFKKEGNTASSLLVATNSGTIKNCKISGDYIIRLTNSGSTPFGVFCYRNQATGTIENCSFDGNISAPEISVGIFSVYNYFNICGCISNGNISVRSIGVISLNIALSPRGTVENCEIYGEITASYLQGSSLFGSYYVGDTSTLTNFVIRNCKYSSSLSINILLLQVQADPSSYFITDLDECKVHFVKAETNLDTIIAV